MLKIAVFTVIQRGFINAWCIVAYLIKLLWVILSKHLVNVAMVTVLLRYPIFIKCCNCHKNKAPWQQKFTHFEGIIIYTHKRKVFPLIYKFVIQMIGSNVKWRHDVLWRSQMTFSDFTHKITLKVCSSIIFYDRSLKISGTTLHR